MTGYGLRDSLQTIVAARQQGEGIAVVTVIRNGTPLTLSPGERALVRPNGESTARSAFPGLILEDAGEYLNARRSAMRSYHWTQTGLERANVGGGELDVFIEVLAPPSALVIAGAGHIAVPLAQFAHLVDFQVTILDDRAQYANAQRFPTAHSIMVGPYRDIIAAVPVDSNTSVVLVTRGHVHDQACLEQVISSPARYIGVIGSKRRVRTLLAHLAERGTAPNLLTRVHAPVGLDIQARTPAEIALSIMAEVVCVHRGGTGKPLSIADRTHG